MHVELKRDVQWIACVQTEEGRGLYWIISIRALMSADTEVVNPMRIISL
jgi:hypothetical protein